MSQPELSTAESIPLLLCSTTHAYSDRALGLQEECWMYRWMTARDVSFVKLQAAVFCVECELISQKHTMNCLACGSKALMNLSRLMGGSLLNQSTANLIQDAALDRVVRELLQTIPSKMPMRELREVPRVESEEEDFAAAKRGHA